MRPEEIRRRYPDIQSERFGSGDFQPEGGERFSEFTDRVRGAFDTLIARIDDGEEAIAVTHGGVIQTIVGSLIGAVDQSAMLVPSNASLTTIRLSGDRAEVFFAQRRSAPRRRCCSPVGYPAPVHPPRSDGGESRAPLVGERRIAPLRRRAAPGPRTCPGWRCVRRISPRLRPHGHATRPLPLPGRARRCRSSTTWRS